MRSKTTIESWTENPTTVSSAVTNIRLISRPNSFPKRENAPRRIALFSLGTMAVYRGLRKVLEEGGVRNVMEGFVNGGCKDKVSLKYVERLKTKLGGSCL